MRCVQCDKPIEKKNGRGRKPKYCSSACRQAYYRSAKGSPEAKASRQTAAATQEPIESENRGQLYRSDHHPGDAYDQIISEDYVVDTSAVSCDPNAKGPELEETQEQPPRVPRFNPETGNLDPDYIPDTPYHLEMIGARPHRRADGAIVWVMPDRMQLIDRSSLPLMPIYTTEDLTDIILGHLEKARRDPSYKIDRTKRGVIAVENFIIVYMTTVSKYLLSSSSFLVKAERKIRAMRDKSIVATQLGVFWKDDNVR